MLGGLLAARVLPTLGGQGLYAIGGARPLFFAVLLKIFSTLVGQRDHPVPPFRYRNVSKYQQPPHQVQVLPRAQRRQVPRPPLYR